MDIIDTLLRTADAYEAEARMIRAANRGGEAASSEVVITVSSHGVVESVTLTSAFTTFSAAVMTEKFWATYRAAVRDAELATIGATPTELHDADAVAIQAEQAAGRPDTAGEQADQLPGAHPLPPPRDPTPWSDEPAPDDLTALRTGRVDWPADIPDGSPAEVMAAIKRKVQQIADDAAAVGPEIGRLRGHGESPEHRPWVRAEVTATGVPTSVAFTGQAHGTDPGQLATHVLDALSAAQRDTASQAQQLWQQAGMTQGVQDPYPLHASTKDAHDGGAACDD